MSLASDKLYNGYLRRNMPTIVSKVKVREILNHLTCLTSQDRETIEAKRETYGNYDSMVLLLDCLKRRENWLEQFIKALEACEQPTLAAEIRAEYEALKEANDSSNPSSPPTTVVRAHVHPAPSASHLSGPEGGANSQAAAAPPDEASAPPDADEASAPPEPAEVSAPPDADEASARPEPAEASARPEPAEASAPPETAEASAPPDADEASARPEPAEASARPEPAEASAPPDADEASAPPEPAEASAPPEPAEASAPPDADEASAPPEPVAQVPKAVSPPEPVPEPPQSTQAEVAPPPSTPAPFPAAPHTQPATPPPPQRETNSHQEPVENSESDIQDVSAEDAVTPDQVSAGNREVSISSVDAPQPSSPVEQCETHTASPDLLQTTTASTEVSPPQSPSAAQMNSDGTDGSSFLTPERPPVQDTSPSGDVKPAAVLQPEETPEPPAAQVVESSPQTEAAATTSPPPGAAGTDASLCDDSSVCLSNSGDSEHLEVNGAAPDAVTSAQLPACSAVSSTTVTTASAPPCQENGITLNHNELEENHHESLCPSLGTQAVLETVVRVSEEPPVLNLNGQSSTPQVQINGEAAKEMTSAPPLSNNAADTVLSVDTCSENHHPSEPTPTDLSAEPKTLQDSEEKTACRTLTPNTKYILTAAGVGACALLMAWRFKH